MIIYKCDQCQLEYKTKHKINLFGYYPNQASGILIPESCREFNFCSSRCFLIWMKAAIEKDSRV